VLRVALAVPNGLRFKLERKIIMKKTYGVVALAAALAGATLLLERTVRVAAAAPSGIKNVVLVHGAFADGSGWEAVAKILEKDGYTVSVAQPPETSYAEDIKNAKAALDAMNGPVVIVGHSYGGSIITEAGNDPKVSALVYIAAFALDDGESCASIEQAQQRQLVDRTGTFRGRLRGGCSASRIPLHGRVAGADLHRLVHPQGHLARLEDQAHLVHGGHRRPIDQSGPRAHDGEARPC
jgi:pimeloyl-ACP methyl ester carboxylesterase